MCILSYYIKLWYCKKSITFDKKKKKMNGLNIVISDDKTFV